jgi:hypothetical protein
MLWNLLLERKTENILNADIARNHLKYIAAVTDRNRVAGFEVRAGKLGEPETILEAGKPRKRYLVRLRLETTTETALAQLDYVRSLVAAAAQTKGWELVTEQRQDQPGKGSNRSPFNPLDIDEEVIREHFADIYEREPHIRILNDAVQRAVVTNSDLRAHSILYGEPGGCKSTLLDRLKTLYDDGVERVVFVDAPTMTKAGLEKWLLEKAEKKTLPEILVMEEIEKCDKDNLLVLGSIMASGYIMRTNAVIGRKQEPARFLIMATCNDEQAIKEFRRGFIWDRFVNQIPCTLPDEDTMHKILLDKISRIPGGQPVWADKIMDLAALLGIRRPRKIIGFLAGRNRLESGSYQHDLLTILEADRLEQASLEPR